MGLAASQGRLLSLTARNHDLVYEAQQISQQRLFLADATKEAADKYNEKMNNKVMKAVVNGNTQPLTYDVLTTQDPFMGLGMRLVDKNGNIVIPDESIEVQQSKTNEETGEQTKSTIGRFTNSSDFVKAYMSDLSEDKKSELSSLSMSEICTYYNDNYNNKDENITLIHRNKQNNVSVKEGEKVSYDAYVYDPTYLQQMIIKGEFKIQQANANGSYEDLVWQGSPLITEVYDTSDDAAAESQYESDMADLQKQDKIFELRLDQVETQQKAVETELESVKSTIKENVEGSFKTFTG